MVPVGKRHHDKDLRSGTASPEGQEIRISRAKQHQPAVLERPQLASSLDEAPIASQDGVRVLRLTCYIASLGVIAEPQPGLA